MIKKNGLPLIYFCWISLLLSTSCKKEMERDKPLVQFVFPSSNSICTADSIILEVRVQDSRQLLYVMAGITGQQAIAVVSTQVLYPKTNDTSVRFVFWPEKAKIRGELEAFVSVSNGFEERKAFLKLYYLPDISFESFLVTSNVSNDGIHLNCWDYQGVQRSSVQIPMNGLIDMQAFAEDDLVFLQLTQADQVMAFNPLNGNSIWTFNQSLLPYNSFKCLHRGASLLWVSDETGVIQGLHPASGEQLVTSTMMQDTAAYLLSESNGFLFAAQKNLSGKTSFQYTIKPPPNGFLRRKWSPKSKLFSLYRPTKYYYCFLMRIQICCLNLMQMK